MPKILGNYLFQKQKYLRMKKILATNSIPNICQTYFFEKNNNLAKKCQPCPILTVYTMR